MASDNNNLTDRKFISLLRSMGVFFPESEKELDRFNELYAEYECSIDVKNKSPREIIAKAEKQRSSNLTVITSKDQPKHPKEYFHRAVLAAEIAFQLHEEPTFGHVKFQKLFYLCEQQTNIRLHDNYEKQVAGPYDSLFMHTIDPEFRRQGWFKVKKEKGRIIRYSYSPLEGVEKYKKYYRRYFAEYDKRIQWIINTFRKSRTNQVELVATLYACWDEAIRNKEEATEELLKERFYSWSKEKEKFSVEDVEKALIWMKGNDLVPRPQMN